MTTVRGANDTVVTQVYLSKPYSPNGTYRLVCIYKKKEKKTCVYCVMQKKQREKAILATHCTIYSREYWPPLTRSERVRKYEKEDESDQTSSVFSEVFLLANHVYDSIGA